MLALLCAVAAAAVYVAWSAESLDRIGEHASWAVLNFYLLYGATLLFAAQAWAGVPVWKLAGPWHALKPWQRGLIVAIVIAIALAGYFVFSNTLEQLGLIDQKAIP